MGGGGDNTKKEMLGETGQESSSNYFKWCAN